MEQNIEYQCTLNPFIERDNGKVNEIDILLSCNGDDPIWIECKAGTVKHTLCKYGKLAKDFQLEKGQMIIICLQPQPEKIIQLAEEKGIIIYTVDELKRKLNTEGILSSNLVPTNSLNLFHHLSQSLSSKATQIN